MVGSPNALIAFPNLVIPDFWKPQFLTQFGNWQQQTPVTNLQQEDFAYKVRSASAAGNSARVVLDLTTTQPVQVVAVPNTNMLPGTNPTVTVNLWGDAAMTLLVATMPITMFPILYAWESVPWEHFAWLTGQITEEEARLFPQPILAVFDTPQITRVVEIIVNDPNNAAGYIELTPPLYVCPGYQPSVNVKIGAQLGINDPTIVNSGLGGKKFFDPRPKKRTFVGQIDFLPQDEALSVVQDMQWRLGTSGDCFFSYLPQDGFNRGRVSFAANYTKLDPLTAAAFNYQSVAFSFEEKVA